MYKLLHENLSDLKQLCLLGCDEQYFLNLVFFVNYERCQVIRGLYILLYIIPLDMFIEVHLHHGVPNILVKISLQILQKMNI